MIRQTVPPFKSEKRSGPVTAHAGPALPGECAMGLDLLKKPDRVPGIGRFPVDRHTHADITGSRASMGDLIAGRQSLAAESLPGKHKRFLQGGSPVAAGSLPGKHKRFLQGGSPLPPNLFQANTSGSDKPKGYDAMRYNAGEI